MALFRGIGARKDSVRGTSPIETRKVLAGLFASTGGIGARSGILPGGTSPLVTGNATWAYNVGLFHAFVSRSNADGGTVFGNDGSALIGTTGVGSTVPIAPGAGLQRIDIAWVRHPTNLENADTASEPLFGVASGTAAASNPVAPVIPAGALEIGRNLMTSAATSTLSAGNTITQSALFTALRGAPVQCRNQAERDALTLFDGLTVYRLDLHCEEVYNANLAKWFGGAWQTWVPGLLQPGAIGITVNYAKYTLIGKTCIGTLDITSTGTGTLATQITSVAPVAAAGVAPSVGSFYLIPAAGNRRAGTAAVLSGSFVFQIDNQSNTFGLAPSYAIAPGDQLFMNFHYEIP